MAAVHGLFRPTTIVPPVRPCQDIAASNATYLFRIPGTKSSQVACQRGTTYKSASLLRCNVGRASSGQALRCAQTVRGSSFFNDGVMHLRQQVEQSRTSQCRAVKMAHAQASLAFATSASSVANVMRRALVALPFGHLIAQVVPALLVMAYAIWGLAPSLRFGRRVIFQRGHLPWEESRTRYMMASYIRPVLLWASVLVICRTFDPIVLTCQPSHAIKERFVNFVRSLSTVLAFAFCTASLTQQIQKFMVERQGSAETSRNLGVQFVGNAVYALVWVAAVCLFMEFLGFSTQKWITAGGFGTVLLTLAGRELFTNFLSSIMIHATRPFMVNEWIQVKIDGLEVSGTVEHVGWWEPTVIRGDDREAVHIPNHKFSVGVVRNLSQKTHWRIKAFFGLSHMDVGKIGAIVATMRKVIAKHPQLEQKHLHRRVVLDYVDPENQAMMIQVSCFVKTSHFEEYLRVKEMVLLDLLKVISLHGARLATPIRSVQRMNEDNRGPYRDMSTPGEGLNRPFLLLETPAGLEQDSQEAPVMVVPAEEAESPRFPKPNGRPVEQPAEVASAASTEAGVAGQVPADAVRSRGPPEELAQSSTGKGTPGRPEVPGIGGSEAPAAPADPAASPRRSVPVGMDPSEAPHAPGLQVPRMAPVSKPALAPRAKAISPAAASAAPEESPAPAAASKGALEGLDSMGLNKRDITLLGAAFEKPPANISNGPLESGPYVGITPGKSNRPLLEDHLLRAKGTYASSRPPLEPAPSHLPEDRATGSRADPSSPPRALDVATSNGGPLASEASSSLPQKAGLSDTAYTTAPSPNLSSHDNDDGAAWQGGGAAFGGSKVGGGSPRPQSVEDNLVLGVALDGPRRTLELPLDGELPSPPSKEDNSRHGAGSGGSEAELAIAGARPSADHSSLAERNSESMLQGSSDSRDRER